GLQLGYLLGGSILVETVFNWPGTGYLLNDAIFRRDMTVLISGLTQRRFVIATETEYREAIARFLRLRRYRS
ncbi:MAG: ABC transporter permease subunit, partial [Cyanobacteria bacterium P01_A01_bin.84]